MNCSIMGNDCLVLGVISHKLLCVCVRACVSDGKFSMFALHNVSACMYFCTFMGHTVYMHAQMYVLTTCAQLYESKIFIYLAETVFIAGNVDEFLVYFLTLPWCLLCLPVELWPVYLCAYSGHYTYTHTYLHSTVWNHICIYISRDKTNVLYILCIHLQ